MRYALDRAGSRLLSPPRPTDWGGQHFAFFDREGHIWAVTRGQHEFDDSRPGGGPSTATTRPARTERSIENELRASELGRRYPEAEFRAPGATNMADSLAHVALSIEVVDDADLDLRELPTSIE